MIIFLVLPLFLEAQNSFLQGEEYFRKENYAEAKSFFQKYLKKNPSDKKTKEYLGDIAAHEKDWDTAIAFYRALAEEASDNANYHFKFGGAMGMKALSVNKLMALTMVGDIKRELERAAKLDENHIEVRWALIEFYVQLPVMLGGSEKKARNFARELQNISEVDGFLALGYISEYFNRLTDAERYYIKAVKIGGSAHTYKKLIQLYEKAQQPTQAMETALQSWNKHRQNQLNYQIGKISALYNIDAERGINCLGHYLANFSDADEVPKSLAYLRLAQIYKNLLKKEIALSWIDKALAEDSNFREAQKEKRLILAL